MMARMLFVLWCCGATVLAQEAKVRTSLATKGDVWVGQKVTFVVELLAPGFFSGAASFDLPKTPGLLLVPPSGSPVVSSETIDDVSYTVQRHEAAVFARRAGEQTIPPIPIRIQFKRNPLDKQSVAATLQTEPVRFAAKAPPGAEKLGSLICARDLQVEETWKPEPGKAKAGDAFTRTITYTAPDVPAMAFPPFPAAKIDGLGIYPKAPEVLDQSDRGSLTGKRRDTITYVCQRSGQLVIPAARFTWFDLDAKQLRTVDFPARTLDVAPNPALASTATTVVTDVHAGSRGLLAGLAVAVVVNLLAVLVWKSRSFWLPLFEVFRPVHLGPLNPSSSPQEKSPRTP